MTSDNQSAAPANATLSINLPNDAKIEVKPIRDVDKNGLEKFLQLVQLVVLIGGAFGGTLIFLQFERKHKSQEIEAGELDLHAKSARRANAEATLSVACADPRGCSAVEPIDGPQPSLPPQASRRRPLIQPLLSTSPQGVAAVPATPKNYLRAVAFTLKVSNPSQLPIRITANNISVFIGHPRPDILTADQPIMMLRPPPRKDGFVVWEESFKAEYSIGSGGNTGLLGREEWNSVDYSFSVLAGEDDWIAVRADLVIEAPAVGSLKQGVNLDGYAISYCALKSAQMWSCKANDYGSQIQSVQAENGR